MSFKGLATGIGSLPFKDALQAAEAVLRFVPEAPFWPQLPALGGREGMFAQFSRNLPGLKAEGRDIRFAPLDEEKELEVFYEKLLQEDLSYFSIGQDFASGLHAFYRKLKERGASGAEFIKGQITGPFTFCAGINDAQGRAILHNKVIMQAMVKGLGMKALWQLDFFKEFGKKMIIFLDEPYLTAVGSAYTTVGRREVIETLSELCGLLKASGCLTGVHCCGNTDWSMLTDSDGVDIINFDAYEFQERFVLYADNLSRFLKKGGVICWGIVPTQSDASQETPEGLCARIKSGLDILARKGIDRDLLLDRLMISPSCGLGTLSERQAEGILGLLGQTSAFIRKNL